MTHSSFIPFIRATAMTMVLVGAIVGTVVTTGCSSTRSDGTITGLAALSESVTGSKNQINRTVGSLQKLKSSPEVKTAYEEYITNLAEVKNSAAVVKSNYDSLLAEADSYITTWQQEIESVEDPALKATAVERSGKVKASVVEITNSLQAAKDAYVPLVTVLDDLKKVLGNDPTTAAVVAAGPSIDKTIARSIDVQVTLTKVSSQLETLRGSLKPTATK